MGTPESGVKVWLVNQFKRKYGDKIWSYAPPGGAFGQSGVCDRLFLVQGILVAIECKSDVGQVTPLQRHRLQQMQDNGAVAASMIGKDYDKLRAIFLKIDLLIIARDRYLATRQPTET